MNQHTWGKWLIHGTKHHKTISCKDWISPVLYPSSEYEFDIKEFDGSMSIQIFWNKM